MTTYKTIQPPFSLEFREMSKKELKEYFRWFQEVIAERIDELTKTVRQIPGFEDWRPDFTPDSLEPLGEWLADQAETRQRTQEEIRQLAAQSSVAVPIPEWDLTNQTLSLAMDVGMYFAQVMLQNHPTLKWAQLLGGKRNADYGQPVLVGFGPVELNPIRIAMALAYSLVDKTRTGKRLRELYNIWSEMLR